jgi:hypothetical protein
MRPGTGPWDGLVGDEAASPVQSLTPSPARQIQIQIQASGRRSVEDVGHGPVLGVAVDRPSARILEPPMSRSWHSRCIFTQIVTPFLMVGLAAPLPAQDGPDPVGDWVGELDAGAARLTPGVVPVSGSGPQDRDEALMGHRPFAVLADGLTRKGVAVLRYDDRGVAASTGEFGTATSRDFASDGAAASAWLAARPEVSAVGIVGHSEGGIVGPKVATGDARRPRQVRPAPASPSSPLPRSPGSERQAQASCRGIRSAGIRSA